MIMSFIYFIYDVIIKFDKVKENLNFANILQFNNTTNGKLYGYLIINLLMIAFFVLHEFSHVIVGVKHGFQPKYIAFNLFLGFIPIWYVKINNLYIGKKRDVTATLIAGMFMNLLLFFIFMIIFLEFDMQILKIIGLANLRLFYINLLPFSLTDGYFMLGILVNEPNARLNYYKFLAKPSLIKKYSLKHKMITIFLFIVSILELFIELTWIKYAFVPKEFQLYSIYLIVFIIFFIMIFIHILNKKKFKRYGII